MRFLPGCETLTYSQRRECADLLNRFGFRLLLLCRAGTAYVLT
nr:hypothetical protein [uncultured Blautia sp.]